MKLFAFLFQRDKLQCLNAHSMALHPDYFPNLELRPVCSPGACGPVTVGSHCVIQVISSAIAVF